MERNKVMEQAGEWGALSDSGVMERPLEPFLKSLWWGSSKPLREARHGETHRPSAFTEENQQDSYLFLLLRVLIFYFI